MRDQLHPKVHSYYLSTLKRLLGASFVGWVEEKGVKNLKVTVSKKSFTIPFEGGDIVNF